MSVTMLEPDPDDFRRAQDIFSRALELTPDQREAFIVKACGSNGASSHPECLRTGSHPT